MIQIQLEAARAAKGKARTVFARYGHVNGVGITRKGDDYAVKVNLSSDPDAPCEYPEEIDGVPVVVHVVGPIHKQCG
jgi:hypothetical protein